MIPARFDYDVAKSVDHAIELLAAGGGDAKLLAGGHSLLPAMKLRIARPEKLVDIGRLSDLAYVKDGDKVVSELQVGDGIGEMSLLARRPATFDVVAVDRTVVLSLSREKFDQVAVNHPTLLAEVYKLLVQRESANQALVHDASELVV